MITLTDFKQIDTEVLASINQALDFIKNNCRDHNYILLLADCEFKENLIGNTLNLNPYAIDDRTDKMRDDTRIDFLMSFLQQYYVFPNGETKISDDTYRQNLEMMIYTHVWESEPFLKKLFRIALLASKDEYAWKVEVPPMGKHNFIRSDIRENLRLKNLALAEIITKGFHTSLRNAFAHSQYSFSSDIRLHNYKSEPWELESISYDDWSRRFAYSFFANYHMLNEIHRRRITLPTEYGTDKFLIVHPNSEGKSTTINIWYDSDRDVFSFQENQKWDRYTG